MNLLKRRRKSQQAVDAVAEIESHQAEMEGRGRPDLEGAARPMAPGAKAFMVLLTLMGFMFMGVLTWQAMTKKAAEDKDEPGPKAKIENLLPGLKLTPPDPPAPAAPPVPTPMPTPTPAPTPTTSSFQVPSIGTTPALGNAVQAVTGDPVTKRRLESGLQAKKEERSSGGSAEKKPATREADSGPMADKLKPMKLTAAQASLIGNRDMLLTQGNMIDCVQDTKFVSAQAGMITCYAPHDIRSTSGRVVLIDSGTKFVGYQQGVLSQGQPRIGVVWSRLETPKGVIIHLDSPGTGPLGEAGLDGFIDTHFAERFGGAIMVSLIGDIGSWASSRSSNSGSISFDNTGNAAKDAVSTVLDNTINIPPTLYRNQGGRLGIYVARDLDFSSVYDLRPVAQ